MKGAVFPAAASGERAGRSSPSLAAVLRTKGVGSVMVGLVVLAMLLGARRWVDIDAVSVRMHLLFYFSCPVVHA